MKVSFNGLSFNIKANKVIGEVNGGYYIFEDSWINEKDVLIDNNMVKYYIVDYKDVGKYKYAIKFDKRVNVGDILYVHYDYYNYDVSELRRLKLNKLSEISEKR